jgi:hypothetical protein
MKHKYSINKPKPAHPETVALRAIIKQYMKRGIKWVKT